MERNSQLGYGGHKKSKKHSQKVLDPMSGKKQKSLKGHSSGFSSDYPHAMETMDDSEGLGSSGRIETGLGALELYNVGRKSISLNDDRSGVFGVPLRVFSLPKLRRSERKELKLRLKAELEQVQVLSKKIAVRSTNGVAFSSASIIHNCNDGPKMPPNQSFQRSSQNMSVPAKKHGSSGQTNGASLKRDTSGRFNCMTQGTPVSTSHVMLMKQCASLLQSLMSHQMGMGGIFNSPVDIVKFNIPDYFTVIQHPMDLGTVKKKLASGNYSSPFEFCADVKLTFSNAMTYNPPGNQVHNSAAKLKEYFELRWKSIEKKLLANKSKSVHSKSSAVGELEVAKAMPPAKKRKVSSIEHKVKPDIVKLVMTEEEKLKLTRDLEPLIADLPVHIANFLREHTYNATQTGDDEIEIDIEDLSDEVLLTLRKLVDDHLREIQLNQEKTEPCEMEVLNESGLSNSSMQPCKGNTIVDEDVDIGGNDPPVSSYPPVEIEKDGAHKKNKCSSSSSSSSDSGSSSSDSDSGSSSGSESHGAKISSPATRIKETVGSDEVLDPKTSDLIDPNDGNQAVSGLDQLEQTSQPRTGSTEADSCQDGEIAPSERQASPEKIYRAALLRSRFADTILKAREKTLVQGEKGDPEKLRREREKLERQQREEKARLQAEARAAEDARKQAEAEYAVEAKRKREIEREAARQALLKMEKSVEINENRQFLEELEMLTVAPAENLPSSVDETSPIHSEDGMGGFKLQGCTNPLEQLGLYMKEEEEEEEEEEEVEPNTIQDPLTDVEEGEID